MPDPLASIAGAAPTVRAELEPAPRRSSPGGASFAEHLRPESPHPESPHPEPRPEPEPTAASDEAHPVLDAIGGAVRSIAQGERFVDGAIHRARRGKDLEPGQLLALQAGVYRYTQELELAAKLVDKATGAVKQTLQSQQ